MALALGGQLTLKAVDTPIFPLPLRELSLGEIMHWGFPHRNLTEEVRRWRSRNMPHLWRGLSRVLAGRILGIPHFYGQLYLATIAPSGQRTELGLASMRVITDVGVEFIVNCFMGLSTASNMKYHGFGIDGTIEVQANTKLISELTTEYNPANTRPAGTATLGDDGAGGPPLKNVFRTKGLLTPTDSVTLVEHGIFSQASPTGGTPVGGYLLDRSVFTPYNLIESFSLEATYDLTLNAGG